MQQAGSSLVLDACVRVWCYMHVCVFHLLGIHGCYEPIRRMDGETVAVRNHNLRAVRAHKSKLGACVCVCVCVCVSMRVNVVVESEMRHANIRTAPVSQMCLVVMFREAVPREQVV